MSTTDPALDLAEGDPLSEPFDLEDLPRVWRHLANESLMYPLVMDHVAMKLGPHRQLFLDNELIARASNLTRQVHQPVRYEGNPIFKALGTANACVIKVLTFDESPRFRMWYTSAKGWHFWKQGQEIRGGTSYAISEDGVHWERPQLDLHKIEGVEERNIVIPYGPLHGVFYEPWEPDPQRRFKAMVVACIRKTGLRGKENLIIPEAYHLHTSPDGIHWTCDGDFAKPSLPYLSGRTFPVNGVGDTSRFWWDSIHRKYIGDIKFVVPGKTARCRGITESDDLMHWARPRPTFVSRNPDLEIYGHTGIPYEGMYVGFRWIFEPEYLDSNHCCGVELDCSRDGKAWTRVGAGQPFMPLNRRRDTWDCDMAKITSLLIMGDEIWFYYSAQLGFSSVAMANSGLAKLRLDGFVSINGGSQEGQLVTRPLGFAGQQLHVNAQVAPGGEIRAGFTTRDGQTVEGLGHQDCLPVEGDGLAIPVNWKSGRNIAALSNCDVRIDWRLRNAKLYSFWIT